MKKAIIFDIDGTLADLTHRLHLIKQDTPDWDAFHLSCAADEVIQPTATVYQILQKYMDKCSFILCTGRSEVARDLTETWLRIHALNSDHLMMRREGDHRPDTEVKREMLATIRGFFDPVLVFEDRASVVEMWREEGLKCFQVAEGDF